MSRKPPLLKVENLQTYFRVSADRPAKAVDGISFDLAAGRTLALVGESGCGKSATAFSIMGLLPGNAYHPGGRILLDGEDLLSASAARMRRLRGNRMAMVFQEPMTSLNPLMRIGRQVAEPLVLHRDHTPDAARNEALALLKRVGIPAAEQRLDDFPHQLSGGMKQRVMIAMALACQPKLLIADEPTTALDVTIQAQILSLMKKLQDETGTAILFITHDLGVVNQVADDVCVMYAGKVAEQGPRENVFRNMAHPYTRSLFASIPTGIQREQLLQTIRGTVPSATDYPGGCRFHPRCPKAFDRCPREESALHAVGPGHQGACHLLEAGAAGTDWELPAAGQRPRTPSDDADAALIDVQELRTHFPVKRGIFLRTVAHIRAVDDISFRIRKGSTVALVGESGCGKTTAGQSLLRLLSEAEGTVVFAGDDIMEWPQRRLKKLRRRLQLVFQDPFAVLSPRMMVGRIVSEGLDVHFPALSRDEKQQRVHQALKEVGLEPDVEQRYPHEFSGGQRQRISIARALVLKPDFLVLDEPTSALDVSVQAQILNLLVRLQARHGLTYLFITHDLGVVEYLADYVAVMYLGRIVEYAPCERLFSGPRHPYTRSLLESIPLPDERRPLVQLQGEVPSPLFPPVGCHFHPRCPVYGSAADDSPLQTRCPTEYPELLDHDGQWCACHAVAMHESETSNEYSTP